MKVIKNINPDYKTTNDIFNLFKQGMLIVDNTFQRRYVWDEKQQAQLIETILLGYDIPELYFWQYATDPETGLAKFSIVDGQQRIGAIIAFVDNKLQLKSSRLLNKNESYVNKFFKDLTDEEKIEFWNYRFSIKTIGNNVSRDEITTLFLRLNITSKCLNPQELRNAQYNGEFLNTAIHVADNEFWNKYNIFSRNEIRRMTDVEFASNLLIFLRKGIKADLSQKAINDMYDQYNNKYYEKESDIDQVNEILKYIDDLIAYDTTNSDLYKKQTHLYTLFVLFYALKRNYEITDEIYSCIKTFFDKYKNNFAENIYTNNYYNSAQDAVKSVANRETRFRALYDYVQDNNKKTTK